MEPLLSANRWPASPSKSVSVVHRFSFCTIDRCTWSCYSIQHCYEKNVPTGVIFDQIFKFKTLLEASSLEGDFSFEYQTWNHGMTGAHRPPTLTLRSRTGAAKPTFLANFEPLPFHHSLFYFQNHNICIYFDTSSFQQCVWCENRKNNNALAVVQSHQLPAVEICMHAIASPSLWHVRGRPGNALDNTGLPRCTHADNNSASRLLLRIHSSFPRSSKEDQNLTEEFGGRYRQPIINSFFPSFNPF